MDKYEKVVEWRSKKTGFKQNFSFLTDISPLDKEDIYSPKILLKELALAWILALSIPFALIIILFTFDRNVFYRKCRKTVKEKNHE